LDRSLGGLRIRRVREFNIALLGKWCWRMREEGAGLWKQVLEHKYGVRKGQIRERRRKTPEWWKYITNV
jgi:hypothetical protein